MKTAREDNTNALWGSFFRILHLIIIGIVCLLVFMAFEEDIKAWFAGSGYDRAELAQRAEERARLHSTDWNRVENGIHKGTGLPFDRNFRYIKSSCLSCHSAKLISQNRATREGWQQMIRWMQATQNLPELGEKEQPILDYLSTHFAPENSGRRPPLLIAADEWYVLESD